MAPFKLKFRMGSSSTSRSVSQETDEPVQQPLLTRQFSINSSNTTIDCEFNNMDSNAEQHNLLPNHSDVDDDTGYENPGVMNPISDKCCYTNIQNIDENHKLKKQHSQERTQWNSNGNEVSTVDDGRFEATVGTQLFLSNPIQSNENLLESTVGSSDPLYIDCNLEQMSSAEDNGCADLNSSKSNSDEHDWRCKGSQETERALDAAITNKSTKKIYKAVAKKYGIACEMSEQCRCIDCQSNYFNCGYEPDENQKTDGGLGAGNTMFIGEVMHGSACTII